MRDVVEKIAREARTRKPHAGLYFDACAGDVSASVDKKRDLVRGVAALTGTVDGYVSFRKRWLASVRALDSQAVEAPARILGRLVVGLGGESAIETGFRFHRTFGIPFLPGSALKGLAAAYARQRLKPEDWGPQSQAYQILFGDTDEAGYVVFHDALPETYAFHEDVMTVHHKEYYEKKELVAADWDSPVPVPFLSASGTFTLVLTGPPAWTAVALQILGLALEREGLGGKTSSGYGRLRVDWAAASVPEPQLAEVAAEAPTRPQAHASPAARKPAAPKAPASKELLDRLEGLNLSKPKDRQAFVTFLRAQHGKWKAMAEADRLAVAKRMWALACSNQQAFAGAPFFKEAKALLGK